MKPDETRTPGVKDDHEKTQWYLLPLNVMEIVVRVLMHGAKHYSPDNWKYVEPKERYFDAALRHMTEWQNGCKIDKDSGLPVLAHAICSLIFLLWHDLFKQGDVK